MPVVILTLQFQENTDLHKMRYGFLEEYDRVVRSASKLQLNSYNSFKSESYLVSLRRCVWLALFCTYFPEYLQQMNAKCKMILNERLKVTHASFNFKY